MRVELKYKAYNKVNNQPRQPLFNIKFLDDIVEGQWVCSKVACVSRASPSSPTYICGT